jgi:hypothetical protein
MYEMEGPRRVPPRTADPVARACALRRDICSTDLANRFPGRRLRRNSRLATLTSRLPGRVVRFGYCLAALTSRLPGRVVRFGSRPAALGTRLPGRLARRDVRLRPWQADRSATVCCIARCPRNPASPVNAGLLDPPGVPRVTPEANPVFSSESFLRPVASAAQGFSRITSRFFCHPQDIWCLSPVHTTSPLCRAQIRPQIPGITTGGGRPAGAKIRFPPTMLAATSIAENAGGSCD